MGPLMVKDTEERIASWKSVYADVKIGLTHMISESQSSDENGSAGQASELTIRMTGDVKLCYYKI